MRLREVQSALCGAILGTNSTLAAELIEDDGLAGEQRLQIHRNNTFHLLADVLRMTFPAVCRLVGKEFFTHAAQAYVRADPPRQPRLYIYGAGFPAFLAAFAPAKALVYLPDVARLEWTLNEAHYAADAGELTTDALTNLTPEEYANLRLHPHPSCRLLASPFPVDRIWEMARPGGGDEIPSLDAGPVWLRISRVELDVHMTPMTEPRYRFAESLMQGESVARSYERALALDPAFDLVSALTEHLVAGTFAAFEICQTIDAPPCHP